MCVESDDVLANGVFGRAVPLAQLPVVRREVFTVAEHRRLEAMRREAGFKAIKTWLAWVVCATLWIVMVLFWRVLVFS